MKTVLVISQNFPPAGGPGVQRVTKFAKYLPDFNWKPYVLTISSDYHRIHGLLDNTLLRDISEDLDVVRTNFINHKLAHASKIEWIPYLVMDALRMCSKIQIDALYLSGGPFHPLLTGYITRL